MGQNSKIEWTDATWNPVTGCTKVSTGCKHCYAERLFPRVYGQDRFPVPQVDGSYVGNFRQRKFTDVKLHPDRLEQPLHWKKPKMIFVNSMSDLFHEDVPLEFIDKIFDSMFIANQHTYQILTKRPERMKLYLEARKGLSGNLRNPFGKHIWLGISCENQATADERIPILLQVPAAVRFLSCEPLLAPIKFYAMSWLKRNMFTEEKPGIHWIIVGGESGPGYRPMKPEWAKSIIEQCQAAGVPVFMKQMAGKKAIPEYLQIREYPR